MPCHGSSVLVAPACPPKWAIRARIFAASAATASPSTCSRRRVFSSGDIFALRYSTSDTPSSSPAVVLIVEAIRSVVSRCSSSVTINTLPSTVTRHPEVPYCPDPDRPHHTLRNYRHLSLRVETWRTASPRRIPGRGDHETPPRVSRSWRGNPYALAEHPETSTLRTRDPHHAPELNLVGVRGHSWGIQPR